MEGKWNLYRIIDNGVSYDGSSLGNKLGSWQPIGVFWLRKTIGVGSTQPIQAPTCCASALPSLKQPCSLSQTKTAIPNPKFGVCITHIYMHISTTTSLEKTCVYGVGCRIGYSQAQGQVKWQVLQGGCSSLKETVTLGIKDTGSADTET